MSFDKPSGSGDRDYGSDRPHERKPPPGGQGDRPDPTPLPAHTPTADEIRARRAPYKSSIEYSDAIAAKQSEAAKDKKPNASGEPTDKGKNPDRGEKLEPEPSRPDDRPDEDAVLRRRVVELEEANARQGRKLASQDAEISQLKVDKAEQAAEIAGLQSDLADRKAADAERDWKDHARDDKIAEQAEDIEGLKTLVASVLKDRDDQQSGGIKDRPDEGEAEGEPTSAIDRHDHDETDEAADRARPTRKWHLPSNTKMTLISSVIGEAAAADHVPTHPSDYVGIGVATMALGTAAVAAWREHRENKQG